MVQILTSDYGHMIYETGRIEKGIFPEADPNTELWKVTNDNGTFYAVAKGFSLYEVDKLPTEHDYHLYSYTPEEGFVYHEPPKTQEDVINETSNDVTATLMGLTDIYITLEEIKEEIQGLKGE